MKRKVESNEQKNKSEDIGRILSWVEGDLMAASLWLVLVSVTWAAPSAPWKERSVTLRRCLL